MTVSSTFHINSSGNFRRLMKWLVELKLYGWDPTPSASSSEQGLAVRVPGRNDFHVFFICAVYSPESNCSKYAPKKLGHTLSKWTPILNKCPKGMVWQDTLGHLFRITCVTVTQPGIPLDQLDRHPKVQGPHQLGKHSCFCAECHVEVIPLTCPKLAAFLCRYGPIEYFRSRKRAKAQTQSENSGA